MIDRVWRNLCAQYDKDLRKGLIGGLIVAGVGVLLAVALHRPEFVPALAIGLVVWFSILRIFLACTLMCSFFTPKTLGDASHS